MAQVLEPTNMTEISENLNANILKSPQKNASKMSSTSANNLEGNHQVNGDRESDEDAPKQRVKRRIRKFSDSDDNEKSDSLSALEEPKILKHNGDDSDAVTFKGIVRKSRIRKVSKESSIDSDSNNLDQVVTAGKDKRSFSSDSESDTPIFTSIHHKSRMQQLNNANSSDSDQAVKYEAQQIRRKNKTNKIKKKFKSLISSRVKQHSSVGCENESPKSNHSEESDDYEASSIEKIKQKIKERVTYKPSICDPDTSDEETERNSLKSMPKQQKERRTIPISPQPKPQRMSAKQAMENMQKIKSESNRMLREKEVSLPYHRPKALSLKDIMSRRKPAVSSDGKCLPIKMNGEQLKQYAQMLEDRQKQMMELWQSDTDEENDDKKCDDEKVTSDKQPDTEAESVELKDIEPSENAKNINISVEENDKLYDDILSNSIIEEKNANTSKENDNNRETLNDKVTEEQDSEANMKLVFNESETSITENKRDNSNCVTEQDTGNEKVNYTSETSTEIKDLQSSKVNTETDSELVSLHYDSEKLDNVNESLQTNDKYDDETTTVDEEKSYNRIENIEEIEAMDVDNGFSDDDMNIEDIDNIIENAEIIRDFEDKVNSQVLIRDRPLNLNPKLTGSPGMVIDLDDSDTLPKKSGVELLKERFTFFAKLKTPDELERAKERQIKPGNQHSRLKQELEEQMAEQRSLEWTKRLEDEKQQQKELKELRGEESDDENDIDKLEAKLEEGNKENKADESADESDDEELLENDIEMKDKPRTKNPILENEAVESDCDDSEQGNVQENQDDENDVQGDEIQGDDENEDEETSDESESSDSEEEQPGAKKGRILKAFEDSDDEETKETKSGSDDLLGSQAISQDDVLTLAQRHKSVSEDLFTSPGSSLLASSQKAKTQPGPEILENDVDLGTQTFSILDSTNNTTVELLNVAGMSSSDKLNVLCEAPYDSSNAVVMCSGSLSQSLPPLPITQMSQSQEIGENILELCTGKFYDNEFVSQIEDNNQTPLGASQDYDSQSLNGHRPILDDNRPVLDEDRPSLDDHVLSLNDNSKPVDNGQETNAKQDKIIKNLIIEQNNKGIDADRENVNKREIDIDLSHKKQIQKVDDNLKTILDELDDPEFDTPRPNRFFCGATQKQTDSKEQEVIKKKFTIDSDDDTNDANHETKKRKKLKKKKAEKKALQISDDEEDSEEEEVEEYESEIDEENEERIVEYDSEENEIEIKPQNEKPLKKKRKGTEFFEQEAELTSEDEWAGSGDEDEAGLDRMEREAGDDESFHQGRLQRELGQIHMRDVLDQDKREVRIIQELLFEDGDLGAGGRQRKFKWKNLDGGEDSGTGADEFDTQEEEFESEEQWRKQRHERETFLRQMQNNGDLDDSLNVSRTTIIKANLRSKTMSSLEENQNQPDADEPVEHERKKDIPSPKKPFSLLQSYQGSILNRGKGALARLAALATPLAVDDDAPKGKSAATSSRRNFVFATLTPEAPKVTKRKAVTNPGTPALVKKMKTEDKQNMSKSRLLDHMKV